MVRDTAIVPEGSPSPPVGQVALGSLRRKASEPPMGARGGIDISTLADGNALPVALRDRLTGLPNQALLIDRVERALARRGGGVSVLLVDLDRFTLVNDGHGQSAGDGVLQAVARRLEHVVSPADTVARFGGDQFVIVIEGTGEDLAVRTAQDVSLAVAAPVDIEGAELYVTASIGIAFGSTTDTPGTVLWNADTAMHQAKSSGGGRFEIFDEQARARAERRLSTESGLRRALDRGEFTLLYQPVVSLETARMVGAEALLRWNHPEKGMVAPDEFIGVAEETGLIKPIGAWVIEQACRDGARWNAMCDASLTVSVNVSGRQLDDPAFVEIVARALRASGLQPACLILEITETALIGDLEPTLVTLRALRGLGVGLAIDDFGTGYSSLSYLSRLPLDVIKIDKCFVDGVGSNSAEAAIMAAVSTLSHSLGFLVLAEGVETHTQAAALAEMDCDLVQGFFFSPPVAADQLLRMVPLARIKV